MACPLTPWQQMGVRGGSGPRQQDGMPGSTACFCRIQRPGECAALYSQRPQSGAAPLEAWPVWATPWCRELGSHLKQRQHPWARWALCERLVGGSVLPGGRWHVGGRCVRHRTLLGREASPFFKAGSQPPASRGLNHSLWATSPAPSSHSFPSWSGRAVLVSGEPPLPPCDCPHAGHWGRDPPAHQPPEQTMGFQNGLIVVGVLGLFMKSFNSYFPVTEGKRKSLPFTHLASWF